MNPTVGPEAAKALKDVLKGQQFRILRERGWGEIESLGIDAKGCNIDYFGDTAQPDAWNAETWELECWLNLHLLEYGDYDDSTNIHLSNVRSFWKKYEPVDGVLYAEGGFGFNAVCIQVKTLVQAYDASCNYGRICELDEPEQARQLKLIELWDDIVHVCEHLLVDENDYDAARVEAEERAWDTDYHDDFKNAFEAEVMQKDQLSESELREIMEEAREECNLEYKDEMPEMMYLDIAELFARHDRDYWDEARKKVMGTRPARGCYFPVEQKWYLCDVSYRQIELGGREAFNSMEDMERTLNEHGYLWNRSTRTVKPKPHEAQNTEN